MKRMRYAILLSLLVMSCSKLTVSQSEYSVDMIPIEISASFTGEADHMTKTVLGTEGKVLWESADEISLFYDSGSDGGYKFVSTNVTQSAKTTFLGNISVITSGIEEDLEEKQFLAIYPYSQSNSTNGTSLYAHVQDTLVAKAGTFPSGSMVSVAKAKGLSLAFYNVCGGIKFKVQEEGIVKVVLKGNNNETLSGDICIVFGNDGKPFVESVSNPRKVLCLCAETEEGFIPGQPYYIPFLPTEFSGGMTFTLIKEDMIGIKSYSGAANIERSSFGNINQLDKDVVFEEWDDPESNYDANRLVLRFSSGEKEEITLFNEYYLKDVTEMFVDGEQLKQPKSKYTFSSAGSHKVKIKFATTEVPGGTFSNLSNLTLVSIPSVIRTIGTGTFSGCKALSTVLLSNNLNKLSYECFKDCKSLKSIGIPQTCTDIATSSFSGCTGLETFTGPYANENGRLLVIDDYPMYFASSGYEWPMKWAGFSNLKYYPSPSYLKVPICPEGSEYCLYPSDAVNDSSVVFQAQESIKYLGTVNPSMKFDNYIQEYSNLTYLYINNEYYPYTAISTAQHSALVGNLIFCCDELLSVEFGAGVRKITNCCVNCKKLTRITFAEGLTHVGGRCFVNLPALQEIRFPDSMKAIDEWCFTQTEALKRVYFGKNLEYLGEYLFNHLFWECVLEDVYFASVTPPEGYPPYAIPSTCHIHVPTASVDAYIAAWPDLSDQIEGYEYGDDYFYF